MADVAAAADVSVMTVSYAFGRPDRVATATRERVLAAAARLGYPGPDATARSLRRRRTGAVGVVLGEHLTYAFTDPGAARFLTGVADVCRADGIALTLVPTTGGADDAARVRAAACDGWVVWTTVEDDPALRAAVDSGKPVAVHGGPRRPGVALVSIDDRAAARAAAQAAFAGAERPAVVSFPTDRQRTARIVRGVDPAGVPFPVTRHRLAGIADHCVAAGIDPAAVPVAVVARNDRDDARELITGLLDDCHPDGVVAMSDRLGLAVLAEARRRGLRVPHQLAVVGWDGSPEAADAGLSSIAQSLEEQGRQCARIALGLRRTSYRAPWRLARRESTRPPG